jgi:hypothetical protein
MNAYLKNETEAEEFDKIVDIAMQVFSGRKNRRKIAEKQILALGAKSVRPLAYAIELALWDHSMDDDDIDGHAEDVSDIILKIGKDALPDLNYLATNGSCNIYVNDWAQELIFDVMRIEGEEKQKVCHHFGFLEYSKEDKNILICPTCGSRIPADKESDSGDE